MRIHPEASVDEGATVHESVVAWAGTHVRAGAQVGARTSLGQGVYVGPGASIGEDCKIQNGAMIYEPADIGNGVFIGPRVVLTNDRHPRAIRPDGVGKTVNDWTPVGVIIEYGAAIGAGAVCVAPVIIREWATVAAGAVVVTDVKAYAVVAGVPARQIAWAGRTGEKLERLAEGRWICRTTEDLFREREDGFGIELVSE